MTVDGNEVAEAEAARLFLYNKPSGLLVTERDPGGRPTIYDKLPKALPRVVPVGRLDLNTEGLQGLPVVEYSTLWAGFKLGLAALFLAAVAALLRIDPARRLERIALAIVAAVAGGVVVWLYVGSNTELGESSMRILWQLLKGGLAGIVLLVGCVLLFRKRAGIVLLHAGVASYFIQLSTEDYVEDRLMRDCRDDGQLTLSSKQLERFRLIYNPGAQKADYQDFCRMGPFEKMDISRKLYNLARLEMNDIAKTAGGIRVAVTGAGPCVFRVPEMEAALGKNFSADAIKDIAIPDDGLNSDIHASAEYRAHLVNVMARRAVTACA